MIMIMIIIIKAPRQGHRLLVRQRRRGPRLDQEARRTPVHIDYCVCVYVCTYIYIYILLLYFLLPLLLLVVVSLLYVMNRSRRHLRHLQRGPGSHAQAHVRRAGRGETIYMTN